MGNILPPPYDNLPDAVQNTLARSHVRFEQGWKGISLADYLKVQNDDGNLDVIKAVYDRCLVYPGVWSHIELIIGGWNYAKGHNVSQGFEFTCSNPDALLILMRQPNAPFCEDPFNVHGPRDSFRELIKHGPGLHVCISQCQARADHNHDIHIDKFQTVCQKVAGRFCNYVVADKEAAKNMEEHMKEAIPWMLGEARKAAEKRAEKEMEKYKNFFNTTTNT